MTIKKPLPDQELLTEFLMYIPETGKLFWKPRSYDYFPTINHCDTWNTRYSGKEAGYLSKRDGYIYVEVFKSTFTAHRLIWKLVHGVDPDEIDHIDGVRNNNKLSNLRDVTHSANNRNGSLGRKNTSGHVGVYWNRKTQMWCAQIKVDGNTIHIGSYIQLQAAIDARKQAENKHNFHENHGKTLSEHYITK